METQINEKVKVYVLFDNKPSKTVLSPRVMDWRGRLTKFKEVIFIGTRNVGQVKLTDVVCTGETADFELEFNGENYLWTLKKVIPKN